MVMQDKETHAPPLLTFDEAVDVLQARECEERRNELVRLVRSLLPEAFHVRWEHTPGPYSTCHIELRFEAAFSVRPEATNDVVAELVDVARCHVIRHVARAVTGGI